MWKALEEECSGQREEQVQRPGSWRRLKNREEARQLEENGRESGGRGSGGRRRMMGSHWWV